MAWGRMTLAARHLSFPPLHEPGHPLFLSLKLLYNHQPKRGKKKKNLLYNIEFYNCLQNHLLLLKTLWIKGQLFWQNLNQMQSILVKLNTSTFLDSSVLKKWQ